MCFLFLLALAIMALALKQDILCGHSTLLEWKENQNCEQKTVEREIEWKSTAHKCERRTVEELTPLFKSQSQEDRILLRWFNGLCGGTYVEMGGLDGITYSNTYVFNKGFNWTGLLVELGPSNFAKLQSNRPKELATVNAAVCGEKKIIHYVERSAVGGVWEFAAESFKEQWWKGTKLEETTEVECAPLRDIVEKAVGEDSYFDFFSLDIEGGEYEALLSLDFRKVGFGIIFAEADKHNHRKNLALQSHLEQNGYTFLKEEQRSHWFVNKQFGSIYKDLLY